MDRHRLAAEPVAAVEERDRLLRFEEILSRLSEGVVLLDHNLRPLLTNSAAKQMLGLDEDAAPARLPSDDLLSVARDALDGRPGEKVLTLWFPVNRTLKVRATTLDGDVLLTLQDVTEEFLAQRIRREFVSHASHELKSPVAGLQTLAGAIRQAVGSDSEVAVRFSDRLVAEAERLGRLINDLLDLSRVEDPARPVDESVDLSVVAERELEQLRPEAEQKAMTLSSAIEPAVRVTGDAQLLALLIRNLLQNAIRYTSEGGNVVVTVRSEGADALPSVSDDGIGIPLEAQARIFERFYRVDRARSRDRGGTGLGLAIVKHVAELHRGTVRVDSELGRGSTFEARIPIESSEPEV